MLSPEIGDPYSEIAVTGLQNFELRGSGLAVPLTFELDAAYITRTLLAQDGGFSRDLIVHAPGFYELCGEAYLAPGRFAGVMSDLRFTFTALRSSLIVVYKQGASNIYQRSPAYTVTDDFGLLGKAK